jgi:hypothetical protein
MTRLSRVVRRALSDAPVSLREIARRAGVSHVQLARIVTGARPATPTVAAAVARALEGIGADCAKRAARLWPLLDSTRGGKA